MTDYKDLIKRLRAHNGWALNDTMDEAADAIEELSMRLHGDEAAIAGMKRENERMIVNAPRWIPVTDRLPEDTHPVLVTYLGYNDKLPKSDMVAMCDDGDWYWYDDEKKCKVAITHWMQLPEPPKEETK